MLPKHLPHLLEALAYHCLQWRGIQQARLERDLDALTFPVIIREHIVPNDEHLDGAHEAIHEPFSFKLLKELKQALTQFCPTSPYTIGLIRGIADGSRLILVDWNAMAKTCLSSSQFLQFKTWWIDGAETQGRHNQTHNIDITKNQLLGTVNETETQN